MTTPSRRLSPAQRAALEAWASEPNTGQSWVRSNTRLALLRQGFICAYRRPGGDVFAVTTTGMDALRATGWPDHRTSTGAPVGGRS